MKALILAAGYGTRLYPLTINLPKPLLLVDKRPMINFLLDKISAIKEIKEIFVVTNDKFFLLFEDWLVNIEKNFKHLRIKIINDGSRTPSDRLGAIGDIQFAISQEKIRDDLLVLGGDNLFDFGVDDFIRFSRERSPQVSVGLFDIRSKKEAIKFGVAEIDKDYRIVSFAEKPKQPRSTLIAMCLYYFPKVSLGRIKEYLRSKNQKDASGNYINWLHRKKEAYGYVFKGNWFDIGHMDSYSKAKEVFNNYTKGVKR